MKNIRIDKEFLLDPRFKALAKDDLKWALGEWLRAALLLTDRVKRCAPKHAWDAENLSERLIEENLFIVIEDEVHFSPPSYCGVQGMQKKRMTPDDLMKIWNDNCGSLHRAKEMTGRRRAIAKQRIQECDDNVEWENVVKWLAKSPWHRGQNPSGWRATIDFLIQPGTRAKVSEKLASQAGTLSIEDL